MKNLLLTLLVIGIVGFGAYYLKQNFFPAVNQIQEEEIQTNTNQVPATTTVQKPPVVDVVPVDKTKTVIGTSIEGRPITAYHFGEGASELLFVGGIHGGYEWNTVLVADELAAYLKANPGVVPQNVKVTVIPLLNPDGLSKVVTTSDMFVPGTAPRFTAKDIPSSQEQVISGRFNGNNVDLNRNFDCDWQTKATWQTKPVSGGTEVFSEPESRAIKQYVETNKPVAVVVWYSAAGGVFSSNCHNGVSAETKKLTKIFADASRYPGYASFDFYATTGDMVNWLAKNNIPAISVLLTNHTDTEWSKNLAGITAVLKNYSK